MWHIYRGVNRTNREVYFGVSKDPKARVDGSHCVGDTKAIEHWDCDDDNIDWQIVGIRDTQKDASSDAHGREKVNVKGYTVIQTAGI